LDILLAHNLWATNQLLMHCRGLTEAQFHQRFDIGPGSLHDTLTHILGSIQRWGNVLDSQPAGEGLAKTSRTPDELLAMLQTLGNRFNQLALSHPLDGLVVGQRGGKTYRFVRGALITHVTTHAVHHRAQCLNMLRQLGATPLPAIAVLDWMVNADPVPPPGAPG
jgi:uncharacterized damage-inducible protein DinB